MPPWGRKEEEIPPEAAGSQQVAADAHSEVVRSLSPDAFTNSFMAHEVIRGYPCPTEAQPA